MFSRLALTICIALVLGSPAIATQVRAQSQEPLVYVALGDSIAYGIGSSLPERRSYPALVSTLLDAYSEGRVELINLAVPGETAASFLTGGQLGTFVDTVERFQESDIDIDIVTVSLGGNELLDGQRDGAVERQQALSDFRSSYDAAIARVRAEVGADTMLVLTIYYDLSEGDPAIASTDAWWIEQFNQVIRDTAAQYDAAVANVHGAFQGHIKDYTHYPYDVHPNNQGFRAIARQVWSAIGFDQDPPEIQVTSGTEATRRTPTLQFLVTDNVDVFAVTVRIGEGVPVRPVDLGGGRYALLLDFRGEEDSAYTIVIDARDSAGNTSQVEHRIAILTD